MLKHIIIASSNVDFVCKSTYMIYTALTIYVLTFVGLNFRGLPVFMIFALLLLQLVT